MGIDEFARKVTLYCQRFRGSVTSWIRTPARNRLVGGVPRSAHLVGLGADVVPESDEPSDVRHRYAHELGLRLIVESNHDHLQPWDWPQTPHVALWDEHTGGSDHGSG